MREYLEAFMTECDYPKEAVCELLSAFDTIVISSAEELYSLLADYDNSYNIDYTEAINSIRALADGSGVHRYTAELLLFLCYTRSLRRYYLEAGISDDIYRSTVLDLKYKLDECKCVYGIYGSFVAYWFAGFFKLERFALGRLQFELIPLGTEYESGGVHLMPDSKVINVHIPRTGTRLDRESTLVSYRLAAKFFSAQLDGEIAFVCNSWLLFKRHLEMLSEGANLRHFICDYDLISCGEYKDYSEVWRLFDTMYDGNPDKLPCDTSLRRAYVDIIRRGERTGWGRGIFIYKE